jgi:hypothetical protein
MLKNRLNFKILPLAAMSCLLLLLVTGCGDNEMTKNITDAVKKTVATEIDKQGTEIKKQVDQVLNPGADKGKEESGKDPASNSGEEKD